MNTKKLSADILHTLEIKHEEYSLVGRRLFTQASMGAPGSVILLVGPTRVGKSKLAREIARLLVSRPAERDDKPIVIVEAATTHGGRFSMRHLTLRLLEQLHHPLVDEHSSKIRQTESETNLRLKLEKALLYRKTRFLIVDEAHHMLRTPRTRVAAEALDSMKCLANTTGVVLILVGGYELFTAGLSSAHLNGRMRVIEFARYRSEGHNWHEFLRVLKGLDAHLPWRKGQSLISNSELIAAGTLGCVGLLLQWTNTALCDMAALGDSMLSIDHFMATRYEEQITVISNEIEAGEAAMKKLKCVRNTPIPAATDKGDSRPARRSRRPFQRNPKRDPVARSMG